MSILKVGNTYTLRKEAIEEIVNKCNADFGRSNFPRDIILEKVTEKHYKNNIYYRITYDGNLGLHVDKHGFIAGSYTDLKREWIEAKLTEPLIHLVKVQLIETTNQYRWLFEP